MTRQEATKLAGEILNAPEDDIVVSHSRGHSGLGWYAWHLDYPEEGSILIAAQDEP